MQITQNLDALWRETLSGNLLESSTWPGAAKRQGQLAIRELLGKPTELLDCQSETSDPQRLRILQSLRSWAASERIRIEVLEKLTLQHLGDSINVIALTDNRGARTWVKKDPKESLSSILTRISKHRNQKLWLVPSGVIIEEIRDEKLDSRSFAEQSSFEILDQALYANSYTPGSNLSWCGLAMTNGSANANSHLQQLERESIEIFREAVASGKKPCLLFSMGKDSMVMLRLAQKAFFPAKLPFPLVVIDTRWKFQEMYRFRNYVESLTDFEVIVHINPEAISRDVNPFEFGAAAHTNITKTEALKQVLDENEFEVIFGGARRDEEKSRAKERIFSVRDKNHTWEPRLQRPELWNIYNTRLNEDQTVRVFPISNWTEQDIWAYIEKEDIPLVPLYFSRRRPIIRRHNSLIMVDDERIPVSADEKIEFEWVRFRTLGCYPLTGGSFSTAGTVSEVIAELETVRLSERVSRVIDFDKNDSMEKKKREGYF